MSNRERDMVESPHPEIKTARNLPDGANAEQSLKGYASINGLTEDEEIAQLAYELYQQRGGAEEGSADGDWFRAEEEVRRRRNNRNRPDVLGT